MKQLILIGLILSLLPLVACGEPSDEQEPPANQKVIVDCAKTVAAHQNLLREHQDLEVLYERTQEREGEYLAAVSTLESANYALRIELALIQSTGEQTLSNYEAVLNEVLTLRAEQKDWERLSKLGYADLLARFNKLNALYPPVHFEDKAELVEWRGGSGNMTDEGYLGLQQKALVDGYILSAHPDLDYCVVIAGDYWYKIIPGDRYFVEKLGKVE